MRNCVTYQNGYAASKAEAEYQDLWEGLVGAWSPSLGNTGDKLWDLSGRGNTGTLTSMDPATDWVTSGGYGALDLDGSDDYLQCAKTISLTTSLSVYTWLYPTNVTGNRVIVSQTDFAVGDAFVLFVNRSGTEVLTFRVGNTTPTSSSATGPTPTANALVLICGTWDGTTVRLFTNNALEHTPASLSGSLYTSASVTLRVGEYGAGASHSSNYSGGLHEVGIFNRAISASEISQLYTLGPGGLFTPRRRRIVAPAAAAATGASRLVNGGLLNHPVFGGLVS